MSIGLRQDNQPARLSVIAAALLLLTCAVSCQQKPAEQANKTAATQNQAQPPKQTAATYHHGVGVIKKITPQDPSVEIDHEEIKGLMPAMKMEFYVKDKSLLDSLQLEDKVDFTIENKQGVEVISEIKKR